MNCLQSHPFLVKVDETLELEGPPKVNGLVIIFARKISEGKIYASNQRCVSLVMLQH